MTAWKTTSGSSNSRRTSIPPSKTSRRPPSGNGKTGLDPTHSGWLHFEIPLFSWVWNAMKNSPFIGFVDTARDGGGVCLYDSGGPVVVKENGHATSIGILSWIATAQCNSRSTVRGRRRPGEGGLSFMADVSAYLDWIRSEIRRPRAVRITALASPGVSIKLDA